MVLWEKMETVWPQERWAETELFVPLGPHLFHLLFPALFKDLPSD